MQTNGQGLTGTAQHSGSGLLCVCCCCCGCRILWVQSAMPVRVCRTPYAARLHFCFSRHASAVVAVRAPSLVPQTSGRWLLLINDRIVKRRSCRQADRRGCAQARRGGPLPKMTILDDCPLLTTAINKILGTARHLLFVGRHPCAARLHPKGTVHSASKHSQCKLSCR